MFNFFNLINGDTNEQPAESGNLPAIDAVIDAYLEAAGGTAFANVKSERREGVLFRLNSGKVPLITCAMDKGRWRYDQTFAWGGRIGFGFDGTAGWMADSTGAGPIDARQRFDLQLCLDIQAPLKIREFFPEMTITGIANVGNREAYTVLGKSPEGFEAELAFDRESGLLLKAGDIFFEDYRLIGEVQLPYKILLGQPTDEDHFQMVMQFSKIEQNLELDELVFVQPECPLTSVEPPLYVHRSEIEVDIHTLETCVGVYQHPADSTVVYTVNRQDNHLMIKRTGWPISYEIKPQTETHYFMEFLNRDFYFVKDESGEVAHLQIGNDQSFQAAKIK